MQNWLGDLNVDESFLAEAAAAIPEASELNRRFVLMIQNATFEEASDTYKAQISRNNDEGGEMNQFKADGINASNGKELSNPPTWSVGSGFQRDNEDGGETALRLKSDKGYEVVHGSTKYGKLIRDLNVKFGLSADNIDSFKQIDKATNKEFVMGPDAIRLMRWYMNRNGNQKPNWLDASSWNGVGLQMDGEYYSSNRDGVTKEGITSIAVGIAKLEGETQEEWEKYKAMLDATGTPLPWYALAWDEDPLNFDYSERVLPPVHTLENKGKFEAAKPGAKPATHHKPATSQAKTETKTEAKTETKAADTKPAANGAANGSSNGSSNGLSDLHTKLLELGAEAGDFKTFKAKAMGLVKPFPHLIPWVAKEDNFNGLMAGDIAELPAKK